MVNVNKLKGKIVERGLNVENLAERIGLDRATLYRKLGSVELCLSEMRIELQKN